MTREQARVELLILAAVTLAGATAGVLAQASVEVARSRRGTRAQLQAAADLIDERDAVVEQLRARTQDAETRAELFADDARELAAALASARGERDTAQQRVEAQLQTIERQAGELNRLRERVDALEPAPRELPDDDL